jgi:hypothetical protein
LERYAVDTTKTLYVKDRKDRQEWLAANFNREKEIWLVYPAKDSDKPLLLSFE